MPHKFRIALPFVITGFIALIFVCVIGSFIVSHMDTLTADRLGRQAYFILLIVLALSVAILLFGLFKIAAVFSGQQFGAKYEFGGPAALFAFIVVIGLFGTGGDPAPEDFNLAIRTKTDDNRTMASAFTETAVANSAITIDVGQDRRTKKLDVDGQVVFQSIPFRERLVETGIALSSNAFVIKDPKATYPIPKSSQPVISIIVIPKPRTRKQIPIQDKKLARITSGGTSDGKSPFCQPRSTTGCVTPQHGGKLVVDSGGLAEMVRNLPARATYKVITNTPDQICVELSASTGACETEIFIQGYPSAVETYEEP
jgi:hypothetical protein